MDGKQPLYLHVTRKLREEIVGGALPAGSQLPAEEQLCERFSVSRHTIREALRRLREDRLVASRKGSGTVVLARPPSGSQILHATSIDDLLAFSEGREFLIDTMQLEQIDPALALEIEIDPTAEWLTIRGVGKTEGFEQPDCCADYYIHRDFAAVTRLLHHHRGPIFPLIEEMFGELISEVHQKIFASVLSLAQAKALHVEFGTAAIIVRRVYRTATGRIAQITIGTHPSESFVHSMTLRRSDSQ